MAATLNSGGNNGGFRTEPGEHCVLVAAALRGNHYGDHAAAESHLVTHTLRAEGADASEDGTGRGVPLVAASMRVRRLTPVECARLQGFPDDWLTGLSDSAQYRCLGNAICVPVAEWIGRRIVEVA